MTNQRIERIVVYGKAADKFHHDPGAGKAVMDMIRLAADLNYTSVSAWSLAVLEKAARLEMGERGIDHPGLYVGPQHSAYKVEDQKDPWEEQA